MDKVPKKRTGISVMTFEIPTPLRVYIERLAVKMQRSRGFIIRRAIEQMAARDRKNGAAK